MRSNSWILQDQSCPAPHRPKMIAIDWDDEKGGNVKNPSDMKNWELKRQCLRFVNRFRKEMDGTQFDALPEGFIGDANYCPLARAVNYDIEVTGRQFRLVAKKNADRKKVVTAVKALVKLCKLTEHDVRFWHLPLEEEDVVLGLRYRINAPAYIATFVERFDKRKLPELVHPEATSYGHKPRNVKVPKL